MYPTLLHLNFLNYDSSCVNFDYTVNIVHCAGFKLYYAPGLVYMCSVTVAIHRRDPQIIDSSLPLLPSSRMIQLPNSLLDPGRRVKTGELHSQWARWATIVTRGGLISYPGIHISHSHSQGGSHISRMLPSYPRVNTLPSKDLRIDTLESTMFVSSAWI